MYPFPSTTVGYDLLWEGIHRRLPWTPSALDWTIDPHTSWTDPRLCVGQACGWPVVTLLRGHVRVVGAFAPDVAEADGHRYHSVVVARAEHRGRTAPSFAGAVAAVNSPRSLSGWVSLIHAVHGPGARWEGRVVWSGAHAESVRAVSEGRADIASIDSVTLAMLRRHDPECVRGLVEVGAGPVVPALPMIVPISWSDDQVEELRAAVSGSLHEVPGIGERILARRFVPLDADDYEPLLGIGPSGDGTSSR